MFAFRLLSCCLLVVFSHGSTLAAEPLLWKFNVGDEHHYQMIQNMEMEMQLDAAGQDITTTMQQTIDMTWKIEKVDNEGIATMLQQISRIQMDMQAPNQPKMQYDTDSKEVPTGFAAMVAPLFKAMTAEPFKITMTPRGEILDVEVPKAFLKGLKAAPGAAGMGKMFSAEGMKKMTQKSSIILPEAKDLEPGHEWSQKSKLDMPPLGEISIDATYAYQGPSEIKKKMFEIFSIKMNMEFEKGPNNQYQVDISGQDAHGEFHFDREQGRLDKSNIQQNMEMLFTAGGQNITQKIVQSMTFETVEKKKKEEKENNAQKDNVKVKVDQ